MEHSRPHSRGDVRQEKTYMKKAVEPKTKSRGKGVSVGQEVIASLKEAIAWAGGESVPVRVTTVEVPKTDVRALRRRLRLSRSQFAAKFGIPAGDSEELGARANAAGRTGARALGGHRPSPRSSRGRPGECGVAALT